MNVDRAMAILRELGQGRAYPAAAEEVASLEGLGLLRAYDTAAKSKMDSEVARLSSSTEALRTLTRTLDASAGPLGTAAPGAPPGSRELLLAVVRQFEELTRLRTILDALVWTSETGRYLQVTLLGRRTLTDLAIWRARTGNLPFETFLAQMDGLRTGLEATIRRAAVILDYCTRAGLPFMGPDLRITGIILSKESPDPQRTASVLDRFVRWLLPIAAPPADQLLAASLLSAVPAEENEVMQSFEQARAELLAQDPYPEMQLVLAASLAGLPPEDRARALTRYAALRNLASTQNRIALISLARCPHAVEEAAGRYTVAKEGLMGHGIPGGDSLDAASAILGGSPMPMPVLLERVQRLLGNLRGVFDPPVVAAAMLSSSPLEPQESMELFKEAVGAISRMNFFDVTLEIENLALLMVYGSGPEVARFSLEGIPPPPAPLVEPLVQPFLSPGPSWFLWHNYWVHRPMMGYIRTHPAHIHTVPYFG